LTKAYAVFLAGDDDYDAMDGELIANFGMGSFGWKIYIRKED
jgi:hypothetical protein